MYIIYVLKSVPSFSWFNMLNIFVPETCAIKQLIQKVTNSFVMELAKRSIRKKVENLIFFINKKLECVELIASKHDIL